MTRTIAVLIALAATTISGPGAAAHSKSCPGGSPGSQGRLDEVTIQSVALHGPTTACILLPPGYGSAPGPFPVLYLLHGAGDHNDTWMTNTDVSQATADLDVIVVMPDAGHSPDSGWYSDWVDGPRWESYHIGELVPFVDARYRTIASREGRAVAGLSMGGFGAMSYAARHPGLFGAAASFSGAVDTADGSVAAAAAFEALHPYFGTPDDRVWGDYLADEVRWRAHNPPDLSTNLRWTDLWLQTGNGVPLPSDRATDSFTEAGVYTMNVLFHQDLTSEGIDHAWRDRGHGTHAWNYWQDDLHAWLPHMMEMVSDSQAPPAFDYRSAEQSFAAWGWSFTAVRDVREFVDLYGVSASGMRIRGSGSLSVLSPPLYEPGAWYQIDGNGEAISMRQAGSDGRLAFDVPLGPQHSAQQYTVEGRLAEATGGPDYWTETTVSITPL